MAISILQQPNQHVPAYNDIIYVASSTNYAQPNFNYLATIYIGSDTVTLKASPDPTYNSGVFNFGEIVESYVTEDISISNYGFQQNSASNKSFYVKFGEEYGASSGVTQYPNLYTSEVRYAWNGCIDFLRFQGYTEAGYLLDTSTRTFNSSGTQYIQSGQDAWQYYISKNLTAGRYAVIKTYNSSDVLIQTVTFENSFQTSGTINHHFMRFGCGTNNLNLAGTPVLGSQPVITASVSYYTVTFSDSTTGAGLGAQVSHAYRYNIVDEDCKYENYRIHYLNELGAIESVNFSKKSTINVDIKRDKFKAVHGGLTSSSAYGYAKTFRGDRTFYTELKDGINISTDWLTDATYLQLEQLVTSPSVNLQDPTHGLVPVTITDSRYERKTTLNDKLIRLNITIQYTFDRYRQRH